MRRVARRRRRRWRKGRVAALLLIAAVMAAGIGFLIRSGGTKYNSVNRKLGEYIVQANEGILSKDTGEKMKKSLYVPRKIDKSKKLIAFTFDDGPSRGKTERVLKALEKEDFRATFFMLGENAQRYPDVVEKVCKSGNEVSGHSWNHPLLTKLSNDQIRNQQDKMNQAIYKACGSKAVSFRPPYGGLNDNVKKIIDGPLVLWNIDTLDWKTKSAKATEKMILEKAQDGDIVLMHDIHEPTVQAVEHVLPILKARGYEVCTVSELLEAKGIHVKKGDVVISAHQIK